jgi:hypothetical protein
VNINRPRPTIGNDGAMHDGYSIESMSVESSWKSRVGLQDNVIGVHEAYRGQPIHRLGMAIHE